MAAQSSSPQAEEGPPPDSVLEICPGCGGMMEVSNQPLFAHVHCPSCGQGLRVRKHFKNFTILDQIGEGGMGAVFKAIDATLNREIALKVLKKECSANLEERAKLEHEAQVTASINHPHVVKVFSFGEDHGEFYLAMELVEKGTLDDLMNLQGNLAEAQVLDVAIQIAEGLEAALERGLIHRDLKPANILFSDAHTAKLVDFGLAIVMDDAAQERGEIWGTPYYIAPEKLDSQPEDFRSDIYSLGGTLFHALAGRPPYEAASASMVALKQLKSQPVSLQAFAPHVSSETAYVINRMLAKNPNDRYASYAELIQHLSYARDKVRMRSEQPQRTRPLLVMETESKKVFSALLTVGLLLGLIIVGMVFFLVKGKQVIPLPATAAQTDLVIDPEQVEGYLFDATRLVSERRYADALNSFTQLSDVPGVPQPTKNWILMNKGLAASLTGDLYKASEVFTTLRNAGPFSSEPDDKALADFFVKAGAQLASSDALIPGSVVAQYQEPDGQSFALFPFAVHDWTLGKFRAAGILFEAFAKSRPPSNIRWVQLYQPLARAYAGDCAIVTGMEDAASDSSADKTALLARLREVREKLEIGGAAKVRLDEIEKQLQSQ